LFRYWVHIPRYIACIILKIKDSNPFVPVGYARYKLGSKGTKGGMTLYHIRYVEVGNISILHGTIGEIGCDQVV
jgi:hypothetical protein